MRSFGALEYMTSPGLFEPLHYHFRYTDLLIIRPSEQFIYTNTLRAVINKDNMVAVVLVVSQ